MKKCRITSHSLFCRTAHGLLGLAVIAQAGVAQDGEVAEPSETAEIPLVDELQPPPLLQTTDADGERHLVSELLIEYVRIVEDQPAASLVLQAAVLLGRATDGWVAPRTGEPAQRLILADLPHLDEQHFYDSALPLLAPAILSHLQELGLMGVYIEPDRDQMRVVGGQVVDSRSPDDTTLTLYITTGVVVDMRTNGLGERLPIDQTLNNPAHERVLRFSPVVPVSQADDAAIDWRRTSLLRRDLLDPYVHFLNRHPGRRVDLAIVPGGEEFGGVSLDYLVTENRPWLFYAQLSNTGTDSTSEFRERFGFVHNQVSSEDDIFSLDYSTGDFDEVHAVTASYDRPIGLEGKLRGRVNGSWYQYTAAEVGQAGATFEGDGYSFGGELRWNFYQDQDLFLDLVGGLRVEGANVENNFVGTEGDGVFLLPSIGLHLERIRESDRILANLRVEGNVLDVDQTDLDNLGRFDTDDDWTALFADAQYSFYLERLFVNDPDTLTSLAHEVAISGRIQWTIDSRLPPNFQPVAGGLYTVRGYPESEVSGDNMFLTSIEYRYHVAQGLAPKARPGQFFGTPFRFAPQYTSGPTDWDFIIKTFVDIGRVMHNNRRFFENHETLIGAGVGLELILTRRVTARVDFAWAIEETESATGLTQVDRGDFEAHFVVTLVY